MSSIRCIDYTELHNRMGFFAIHDQVSALKVFYCCICIVLSPPFGKKAKLVCVCLGCPGDSKDLSHFSPCSRFQQNEANYASFCQLCSRYYVCIKCEKQCCHLADATRNGASLAWRSVASVLVVMLILCLMLLHCATRMVEMPNLSVIAVGDVGSVRCASQTSVQMMCRANNTSMRGCIYGRQHLTNACRRTKLEKAVQEPHCRRLTQESHHRRLGWSR